MPSSDSASRLHCDAIHSTCGAILRDRRAAQFVIGAEHVEYGRRIGQQVLAALAGQADRSGITIIG